MVRAGFVKKTGEEVRSAAKKANMIRVWKISDAGMTYMNRYKPEKVEDGE